MSENRFDKNWFSASELASFNLPDCPTTKRGFNKLAAKEDWLSRPRKQRGGGVEYALHDLPKIWAREIKRRANLSNRMREVRRRPRNKVKILKAPKPKGRPANTGMIDRDEELRDLILSQISDKSLSIPQLYEWLELKLGPRRLPSLRRLQDWIRRYEEQNPMRMAYLRNRTDYRNRYALALGRADAHVKRLNQLWEIDSSPTDVLLDDGRRHAIIGVIDIFSRRALFHVARSSTAKAVASLLRRAIWEWGVPETIKTDNGADYVSAHIKSSLKALKIEQKLCMPGRPQEKPHIERLFHTLQHDLVEALPGFIGHNVAERKAIEEKRRHQETPEGKRLTPKELQHFFDVWIEGYENRRHASLKMTPRERARDCRYPITRVENERMLDIFLSPLGGTRHVSKKGIQANGTTYWADDLLPYMGRQVMVRINDEDLGQLFVFDEADRFLCIARNFDHEGISAREIAVAAKRRQRDYEAEIRADLRALKRRVKPETLAQDVLRARAKSQDKLIDFPKRETAPQSLAKTQSPINHARATLERDCTACLTAIHTLEEGGDVSALKHAQSFIERPDFPVLVDWLKTKGKLDQNWTLPANYDRNAHALHAIR